MKKLNITLIIGLFIFTYSEVFAQEKVKADSIIVYQAAEVQPIFPGGYKEMYRFINANKIFPKNFTQDGLVVLTFVVDTAGKLINPVILKSYHQEMDIEALRLISIMPNWIPGSVNKKVVNVRFNLPISFTLKDFHLQQKSKSKTKANN